MIATISDACREYARNVGHERPDQAWILTDYDTWQKNPFYVGPPVPHPECDDANHDLVAGLIQPADEVPDADPVQQDAEPLVSEWGCPF